MRISMSRTGWLLVALFLSTALAAQEAGKAPIPDSVSHSLDGLQKTRTANGVFNIRFQGSYFWALERSVYVNVAFSADLDADAAGMKERLQKQYDERVAAELKKLEELNRKIKKEADKKKWQAPALALPENFHNLYMRVLKEKQVIQEYRARVPHDGEATAYYSFGTVLEPGDYEVHLDICRIDGTLDGTQIIPVSVPLLRLGDIIAPARELKTSVPVFYSTVRQLPQAETRFSVVKNKYENGPAGLDFFPWGDKPFRSGDKPILTFFVLGAVTAQGAEPWNISADLQIRRGQETVAKFAAVKLTNPYFYQPIEFVRKEKEKTSPLAAGEYVLAIELADNNQGNRVTGVLAIPFRISE